MIAVIWIMWMKILRSLDWSRLEYVDDNVSSLTELEYMDDT